MIIRTKKLRRHWFGEPQRKERPVFDSLTLSERKATVLFSDKAMSKMLSLVMMCPKEVGWHGSGRRLGTGKYMIDDIYIYPQTTTGATIHIDDERYGQWLIDELIKHPDRAETRCFHGHSHVNMGVFASGVDKDYQDDTIEQIQPGDFYIFMIINKRLETWFNIVDRVDNVYYRDNVKIGTKSGGMRDIVRNYMEVVK